MTIHKSQGQTLRSVGVYLPRPVFAHGLLYVAMSRVGDRNDVRIMVHDMAEHHGRATRGRRDRVLTRNVVYTEVRP